MHSIETGPGAQTASYPIATGASFSRGKGDMAVKLSAEVKTTWICTSTPPYAFMA
jgi:hypothetical protein